MARELDAAVATAMGWMHRSHAPGFGWRTPSWREKRLPRFFTEIAAAYQVVEWMNRERKWVVRVESDWDGSASVEVFTDDGTPSHWRSIADVDADTSPAEAICWAFLAAMGVDWREEE